MPAKKWPLIVIILIGGVAVLGSYVYGSLTEPNASAILWGGVPEKIRPFYTINMFLAAAGYFLFTFFILFRLHPTDAKVTSRLGFGVFNGLYAATLFPSALWLPLTFLAVEQSSLVLLWMVRIVLGVVGAASLGLFLALLRVRPSQPAWAYQLALVGCVCFCIQTVILDALVWGAYFRL